MLKVASVRAGGGDGGAAGGGDGGNVAYVSSTPTLSWPEGANITLLPTATAPDYLNAMVFPQNVVPGCRGAGGIRILKSNVEMCFIQR